MKIDVLGIDIAKNTFQLHGVDSAGSYVSIVVNVFERANKTIKIELS